MGAKIAKAYGRVVCAGVAFLLICGFYISSPQAACWITVDGTDAMSAVSPIPTLETSRTIQAAGELYPYLFGVAGPSSVDGDCLIQNMGVFGLYVYRRVCIDGSWYYNTWCTASPDCMYSYYEEGGNWDVVCECQQESDCTEGYTCVVGVCEPIPDNAPVIGDGPLVTSDWKVLPTSLESPRYINENTSVLWAFSDDYASCSESCTHTAEYQALGESTWTPLTVNTDPTGEWYAYVDLPIESLQNATTYAFRFAVTDCAGQTTQSNTYYFRVATSDAPPVIGDGPLLSDSWKVMPASLSKAPVLNQNDYVLWTFSDDYASCAGLCTHRARYKRVDAVDWTWITVSTDPTGEWYAYCELPIVGLAAGTYQFHFDVRDCAAQRTYAPKVYYCKVE